MLVINYQFLIIVHTVLIIYDMSLVKHDTILIIHETISIINDTILIIHETISIINYTLLIIHETISIINDTLFIIHETISIMNDTILIIHDTHPSQGLAQIAGSLTQLLQFSVCVKYWSPSHSNRSPPFSLAHLVWRILIPRPQLALQADQADH